VQLVAEVVQLPQGDVHASQVFVTELVKVVEGQVVTQLPRDRYPVKQEVHVVNEVQFPQGA
jgi:hypothetical protein